MNNLQLHVSADLDGQRIGGPISLDISSPIFSRMIYLVQEQHRQEIVKCRGEIADLQDSLRVERKRSNHGWVWRLVHRGF